MKPIIVLLLAMFAIFSTYAQKAKGNLDTTLKAYLTYSCPMHQQYVSNVPAKCPVCNSDMTLSKKEQMKAEVVKLYTCPMDKDVFSTRGGKCPKCGMTLVEKKASKSDSASKM